MQLCAAWGGQGGDDGDGLCHFIFCGLRILRDQLCSKISQEAKNKKWQHPLCTSWGDQQG